MRKVLFIALISFLIGSCSNSHQKENSDKSVITVSVLPQKYFIEKIAGDIFSVNVMIPPGASPVTYEPTPKQMKELSHSDIYFRIGHIEFEKSWMKKLQNINSDMKVYDQSKVTNLIYAEHSHEGHDHHGHHHHGTDPHIWTSPKEVKKQAEFIYKSLLATYSEREEAFTTNYNSFLQEIDSLDNELHTILEPFQGKKFLIFHPALSYFARDYGLEQISIEIDGKEPTPANIRKIINTAKEENIKVVFVQQQFSTHNAEVIADEIQGQVVQIDPLAPEWGESIRTIANEIVKSYKE